MYGQSFPGVNDALPVVASCALFIACIKAIKAIRYLYGPITPRNSRLYIAV